MNFYPKNVLPVAEVKKFVVVFYVVGIVGFVFSYTRHWFVVITPFALLLNMYLLADYHQSFSKKELGAFIILFCLGFFIECVGVNTGLIFGNYGYGSTLGFKILNTPLLIGLNWLFLSYVTYSIAQNVFKQAGLRLLLASALMLVYDFVLEKIALKMNMWHWKNVTVPIQNYIAWGLISFLFVGILYRFKVRVNNPLAWVLFVCQLLFFISLFFAYYWIL